MVLKLNKQLNKQQEAYLILDLSKPMCILVLFFMTLVSLETET